MTPHEVTRKLGSVATALRGAWEGGLQRDAVSLGLASALALILGAWFYTGYFASDDHSYLSAMAAIGEGRTPPWSLAAVRFAITVPGSILYALADGDAYLVAAGFLAVHPLLVLCAYAVGNSAHDRAVGLLAAWVTAGSPLLYIFSGAVLPDNMASVYAALATWGLIHVRERRALRPGGRGAAALHLLVGAAVGLVYSCKETGLVLTVAVAIAILATHRDWRNLAWVRDGALVLAGFLAIVAVEMVLIRYFFGEWRVRLSILGSETASAALAERAVAQGTSPLARLSLGARVLGDTQLFGMPIMVAAASVYPFLHRRSWTTFVFVAWPLLYLTVGSTSLTHYVPPSIQPRYYALVAVPLAVVTATVLRAAYVRLATAVARRKPATEAWLRRAAVLALVVLLTADARRNRDHAGTIYAGQLVKAFARAFQAAADRFPAEPIVLSPDYMGRLAPALARQPTGLAAPLSVAGAAAAGPPYVYLAAVDMPPLEPLIASGAYDPERMTATLIDIAYPPSYRSHVLAVALRDSYVGEPLRDTMEHRPYGPRNGVAIIVVRPGRALDPPVDRLDETPFFALSPGVLVRRLDANRVLVEWRARPQGAYIVQGLDGQIVTSPPPIAPQAALAKPEHHIRLTVGVRSLRGTATVKIVLQGFGDSGAYAASSTSEIADGDETELVAELQAAEPIARFRPRLQVATHDARAGGLLITSLRLEPIAGPAAPTSGPVAGGGPSP